MKYLYPIPALIALWAALTIYNLMHPRPTPSPAAPTPIRIAGYPPSDPFRTLPPTLTAK